MNRGGKKLAAYGQEFEEDDDESSTVSKKPTAIQDQIVTDEKGKRRFHGAFTGGFSAGYWNTVGSKIGWVPKEFSSSRDSRGDKVSQRAEDFMDAEDLGEYGIGSRSIQQTSTFGDANKNKRKLAWERDSTSISAITQLFEDVVKPVSDSIGVRMLRSMGWREGRGIGLANVKQKKKRGGETEGARFDREQASKIAPGYELANEDVLVKQLQPLTGAHGIGYEGLRHSSVLDESFGKTTLALKANSKSKGIRGQAFGVGAFENEDESIYSNYDLAQFDFSLDVSGRAIEDVSATSKKVDADFEVQPTRLNARKFYAAPRLPPNFRGEHKPIPMDTRRLPSVMKEDVKHMTAVQRAKFLGEDRISALDLVKSAKDQGKNGERRSRWDIKAQDVKKKDTGGEYDEERDRQQRNRVEFPEEPMKQARFKEYLHYIRRGLPYPQPTDLSIWEWESEKKEFESKLTVEERAALPEVQSRSQPLARTAIAAPIHEIMANKFVKEVKGDLQVGRKDEDKLAAVRMEMFGEKTRQSFEWYPDSLLARRFNVPHPYPGAEMVGVPHLQRTTIRKENLMDLGLAGIGMPNTANELEMRDRLREKKSRRDEESEIKQEVDDENPGKSQENENSDEDSDAEVEKIKESTEKAPKSFFDYVFGGGDSSGDEEDGDSDLERERVKKREKRKEEELKRRKNEVEKRGKEKEEIKKETEPGPSKQQKIVQIDDEDDDIQVLADKKEDKRNDESLYGPAVPANLAESKGLTAFSVLKYLQEDLKKRRDEKSSKKKKKKEKKSKKEKKHKKDKKKKEKKKYDESSTSSDEWEEDK